MAKHKTFTQQELEAARQKLAQLPDLSKDKMSQTDVLQSLKEQIITLSSSKGYSQAEIKSALSSVGIAVSIQAISDLIGSKKRTRAKNTNAKPLSPVA